MKIAVFRHAASPTQEPFIARQIRGLGPDVALFTISSSHLPRVDVWSLANKSGAGRADTVAFQLTRRSPKLRRALRDFAPDVVLAHFAQDAWRIERIVGGLGVPLVAVIHGSDVLVSNAAAGSLGLSARQLRRHWPELIASVALFLPVSDHVRSRLRERGVPESKIVRHYLGVEVPAEIPRTGSCAYDIGYFGRLEPNKGAFELVRAIGEHRDLFRTGEQDLRVLVVGDGSERKALEELAESLRRHRVLVDVVGFVAPELVGERMAACSVVCCPSVKRASGISEGLGLTSLEAQAVGRPVVAFATGGLSETVRDGETGMLISAGEWGKMVAAVAALLDDHARLDAMGAAGRRWVKAEWEISVQNRVLMELLATRFG